MRSYCQNCDWRGDASELREIHDLSQRVSPGELMPSGECPECGALCQPLGDPWATIHGFLEERSDFLRVGVSRCEGGFDVVLRLDGTYASREWAESSATEICKQLATILKQEVLA